MIKIELREAHDIIHQLKADINRLTQEITSVEFQK